MKKVASILVALVLLTVGSYVKAEDDAYLTVIHGISFLPEPVDVYVNGVFQFSFDFEDSVGPLALPADSYDLEVRFMGDPVLFATAELESGKNYTAIAHETLQDNGGSGLKSDDDLNIKLSLFENNVSPLGHWKFRLTLRHTADAPEVDIDLRKGWKGKWFFAKAMGLSNNDSEMPEEFGAVDFWWGYFTAIFYPAGTNTEVFRSDRLKLTPGTHYIVYAIGSIFDGSFTLFVQTIDL
jgi:hypothetical protein